MKRRITGISLQDVDRGPVTNLIQTGDHNPVTLSQAAANHGILGVHGTELYLGLVHRSVPLGHDEAPSPLGNHRRHRHDEGVINGT
jgi:hypothetical protein